MSSQRVAVWKFPLIIDDRQLVYMPVRSKILTVQEQNGQLCIWALVDPSANRMARTVRILGTGHVHTALDLELCDYVGTVQQKIGESVLVWHVFIKREGAETNEQ